MPTLPPNPKDERQLLKAIKNHAEFRSRLNVLSMLSDLSAFDIKVASVARCWFRLAQEHLAEAATADTSKAFRSAYSRAYYAIYNASKSVRYLAYGEVSLRGDDHARASELPGDFPQVAKWTPLIASLYEHRLRADYDNWADSASENTLSPSDCLSHAKHFIVVCQTYVLSKYKVTL